MDGWSQEELVAVCGLIIRPHAGVCGWIGGYVVTGRVLGGWITHWVVGSREEYWVGGLASGLLNCPLGLHLLLRR